MSNARVKIIGLSTAVPTNVLTQAEVAACAAHMFADRYRNYARMAPVFVTAGIDQRYSARPMDWFMADRGWRERNSAYLETATDLFIQATRGALQQSGLAADQIDTVVTISSTGIATPSLEARAHQAMGFREDVRRVPVFGLGCAGGVTGVALAARLAEGPPGSKVLLVVVELCTLAFRLDQLTKANIVATALFGDGAAAAIFSTEGEGIATVHATGERLWPETLDIMGWDVDSVGFDVIFAQAIPGFVKSHLRGGVDAILASAALTRSEIDRFICHPGGTKVIKALEESLELTEGTLDHEREILRTHGNMSAPTVLFVLERALAAGQGGRVAISALGPGFTLSSAVLDVQ